MKIHIPARETIFGVEDGIVSTLGVVIGMAAGTNDRRIVILSALVLIIVESLSMAAGTYLSNKSEMEIAHVPRIRLLNLSIAGSLFMGVSYVIGGLVSVLPFFIVPPSSAIIPSIILSITSLFAIGYVKGNIAKINPLKSGLEMSFVSLSAAFLGYLAGKIISPLI